MIEQTKRRKSKKKRKERLEALAQQQMHANKSMSHLLDVVTSPNVDSNLADVVQHTADIHVRCCQGNPLIKAQSVGMGQRYENEVKVMGNIDR